MLTHNATHNEVLIKLICCLLLHTLQEDYLRKFLRVHGAEHLTCTPNLGPCALELAL